MEHKTIIVTEDDIRYFKEKVLNCTNEHACQKYQKQLEVLEDSLVIYKLQHGTSE